MSRRGLALLLALGLLGCVLGGSPARAAARRVSAAAAPGLTAAAARAKLRFGGATHLSGELSAFPSGNGGVPLDLEADPYPFGSFRHLASTATKRDGSYSFAVAPQRNTRYRVVVA